MKPGEFKSVIAAAIEAGVIITLKMEKPKFRPSP
jgi:hypothetical protein